MNKIYKNTLFIAASALLVASCDLDLVPTTAIAYSAGSPIFTSADEIASYERGLYGQYRRNEAGATSAGSDFNWVAGVEVMFDGFNAHVDYGNRLGDMHRTDASFTSSNYEVEYCWAYYYFAIKDYNIVIENAYNCDSKLFAAARKVKGEAHFFRASSYLNLARLYGAAYSASTAKSDLCVPLVLKYNQNELPARASVADVYAAVKADLDSAAVILAGVKGAVASQTVTIDAVNALYARYYLEVKDYEKAAAAAESVIGSAAGYAFSASVEALADQYINDNGKEALMQLYASKTENAPTRDIWANFTKTDKAEGGFCFQPDFVPTKKLISAYEPADFRFGAWFTKGELPVKIKSDYTSIDDFYVFIKYVGNQELSSTGIPNGYNAIKPFLLSEQYLIAAEAYLGANKADKAKEKLNALQVARGATATAASKTTIQDEWFKETVGEGMRMFCLKRWGLGYAKRAPQDGAKAKSALMVDSNTTAYAEKSMDAGDYHFQWPIPSYEMKVNDNLVQNPGYTTAE